MILPLLLCITLLSNASAFAMKERIRTFMSKQALLNAKFLKAAKKGDLAMVERMLIQAHDFVNTIDKRGNTALHLAAGEGYEATITLLVQQGALVNAKNAKGETPLHAAALGGWSASITLLAAQGALINAQDAHGNTPLHFAVHEALDTPLYLFCASSKVRNIGARNSKVTQLLNAGACIDIKNAQGKLPCDHSDPIIAQHIYAPLMQALEQGNTHHAQAYLAQGANPNFNILKLEGNGHHVPFLLQISTFRHNARDVRMLLDAGANPTQESPEASHYHFDTPSVSESVLHKSILTHALRYGGPEMAELLITHVPRWLVKEKIKNIAFPLLLCLKQIGNFPQDIRKMLCIYCIAPAIMTHQHERATIICSQAKFELRTAIDELKSRFDPTKVAQYYPLWEHQIHNALKDKPKGST